MVKEKTVFVCQQCGGRFPKWQGQCPACGEWNSLVEEVWETTKKGRTQNLTTAAEPKQLSKIRIQTQPRMATFSSEFDRVLGGGLVPGSVILIAGEPGIGKSTLLLKLAAKLGKSTSRSINPQALYISGEESEQQIKLRADRLDVKTDNLFILAATDVDQVTGVIANFLKKKLKSARPDSLSPVVVVDSIQAMETTDLTGSPGTVGQVRECALRLTRLAKTLNIPLILVGQVTKEGSVAGPKVLEHLVDAVLYLEGERFQETRLLRSMKNRFGPTDEVGVFQMTDQGLVDVTNPSLMFLTETGSKTPGAVVVPTLEGTRPILVEIQALVVASKFTMPRRVASGVRYDRLQFLTAVVQRRLSLPLDSYDVYVNAVGGLRIEEPAADLGICLAIYSSLKNQPVKSGTAVMGEVGLLGEIRRISQLEKRIKEAKKLGYQEFISPDQAKTLPDAIQVLFKQ